MDRLEDGSELLIDYKSSSPSLAQWLGERPAAPQLPLYALTRPESRGLAFAELKPRKQRFLGLGVAGVPGVKEDVGDAVKRYSEVAGWEELLSRWEQDLNELAKDFLAGAAEVDPLPNACNYCGMQALCRVALATGLKQSEPESVP